MTPETYGLYLAAVAVFFASPPDTSQLPIIANSMRHGLRRSLFTVAGDLSANIVQMTAAAFGLAAVIASSATAFLWVKWLGVAYLVWIGVSLIRSRSGPGGGPRQATMSGQPGRLFRQGFVTSMANPFAVVFFGALFPQFIDPAAPVLPQLLILGVTYLVVDGTILVAWGLVGLRAGQVLKTRAAAVINRICGSLMIGAALLLAGKDLSPPDAPR